MIINEKKWWYIQWHYIRAKVHCRQYPQWHSGPDHFCIDFLKDDSPFDIFKLLDRLFHILLPCYLIVLWPYVIVLNLGCMRGIKSLNSYAIHLKKFKKSSYIRVTCHLKLYLLNMYYSSISTQGIISNTVANLVSESVSFTLTGKKFQLANKEATSFLYWQEKHSL